MSKSAVSKSVLGIAGVFFLLLPIDGLRALGLGEARVDSFLGQPLEVTIRLLSGEGGGEVEDMTVSPADVDAYERLGVPAEALALGLEVTIDRSTQPPSVRLTSSRPAEDPIIRVLLDARWSNGRVLREYTLFLDPPTVESPPPAQRDPSDREPVAQEQSQGERESAQQQAAEQRPDPVPARDSAREQAPSVDQPAGTVPVRRGDTLWSIARDWRPDSRLSMDQVMLAIFERNQQAFLDQNINRLRSDVELDMPSIDEVRALEREQAELRIREQMQAWQQIAQVSDVPEVSEAGVPEADPVAREEAQPDDGTVSESAADEDQEDIVHRLDVVPPEEDEHADGPVASEEEVRRVRGAVSDLEDEILAERLEGEGFDEEIAEIRELVSTRDAAGVAVAEEMLAELEARLREARREREEADEVERYFDELAEELVDAEGGSDDSVGDEPEGSEELAAADGGEDGDGTTATDERPGEAAEGDSEMATTETRSEGGFPWLWAGLVLLVLIVAAAGWWWLRRRSAEPEPEWGHESSETDAVAEARREVEAEPTSLAAHLMLLHALSEHGDPGEFRGALDDMYRHVEDDGDGYWQEALELARAHAPDHPLLVATETDSTPGEASEVADIERRDEELMDMLESAESEPESEAATEMEESGADAEPESEAEQAELGEDVDLGELSGRLDKPREQASVEIFLDEELADLDDFGEFADQQGDASSPGDVDAPSTESPEQPAEEATSPAGEPSGEQDRDEGLDLDFEFSSSADEDDLGGLFDEQEGEGTVPPPRDQEGEATSEAEEGAGPSGSDAFELAPEGERDDGPPEAGRDDAGDATERAGETEPETDSPFDLSEDSGEQPAGESTPAAELSDEDSDVKLDLARAYLSVELTDSARTILEEVASGGSPDKQAEAQKLLDDL